MHVAYVDTISSQLRKFFERLEAAETLSENDISTEIEKVVQGLRETGTEPSQETISEALAFSFIPKRSGQPSSWGTYFGPLAVWKAADGRLVESPNLQQVSAAIFDYWEGRMAVATHPVLRARYADLLWDFAKPLDRQPEISHANAAIDAYVNAITSVRYQDMISAITYAGRALSLSISTTDSDRIQTVRDAIIELERKGRQLDLPGTWGIAFDLLVENRKSLLTDEQQDYLINDLEQILQNAVDAPTDRPDPFIAEYAAMRLARQYRRTSRLADARRVLDLYAKAFIAASEKAAPMQANGWLRRVYGVLQEYGMREAAEELATRMTELGKKSRSEMVPFRQEIKIPVDELEKLTDQLTSGTIEETLARIAVYFTPKRDAIAKQVRDNAKIAPLMALIPTAVVDSQGRTVAQVGSVEDDIEGRIAMQMSHNFIFESFFVRQALEAAFKKHDLKADMVVEHIFGSPVFSAERKSLISKGLEAFTAGDWPTATHLLVPQIEAALRRLLEVSGRPVFKMGRHGGLHLRSLDDILVDPAITDVFGEDRVTYMRVLLTDPRGWNVRNNLCHGMVEPSEIGNAIADRVLHVFLVLALVRFADKSP